MPKIGASHFVTLVYLGVYQGRLFSVESSAREADKICERCAIVASR